MLNSFIPYLKCVVPIGALIALVFCFMITQRAIAANIIAKPIPPGGFPSVEEEIRYVNDQPAETRRNMKYRSWIIFFILFCLCLPVSYIVPVFILKLLGK